MAMQVNYTMGPYRITGTIAHGGMGVVYRAEHELLGREVALKMLLPELTHNRNLLRRFFAEAKAASRIRHPGIVEIYDFGFDAQHGGYIVMEFLQGESLLANLRRCDRCEPGRAIQIARQIACALGAAHDQGIVHRDLKPGNVFLVSAPEVPGGERVKLLDFGIAKLTETEDDAPLTRTGIVMGTPWYMSPEQCQGRGQVDARADLYALGCLLFRMLCGRPPFANRGSGEVLAAHILMAPPRPRTLLPTLPEPLEAAILCLLEKSPGRRFQRAADVIAALDQITAAATSTDTSAGMLRASQKLAEGPQTTLSAATGMSGPQNASPDTAPDIARPRRTWQVAVGAVLLVGAAQIIDVSGTGMEQLRQPAGHRAPAAAPSGAVDVCVTARSAPLAPTVVPGPTAQCTAAPDAAPTGEPGQGPALLSALGAVGETGVAPTAPAVPDIAAEVTAARPPLTPVEILSTPTGAQIILRATGKIVGTTPWQGELALQNEPVVVIVRARGYRDQRVAFAADRSPRQVVHLKSRKPLRRPSGKTTDKPSRKRSADDPLDPW